MLEFHPIVARQQAIAVVDHDQHVFVVEFRSNAFQAIVEASFRGTNTIKDLVVQALKETIDSLTASKLRVDDAILEAGAEVHVPG